MLPTVFLLVNYLNYSGLREHNTIFEKIQATRYPAMHSLSKKILRLQVVITSYITKLDSIENKVKNKLIHQWFCNLYGESFRVMMCHPNDVTTEAYQFVCDELIELQPNSTEMVNLSFCEMVNLLSC